MVAELVERRPHLQEIGSFVPGQVKPMTYKNWYLSLPSLVLGINKIGHGLVGSVSG